MRKRTRIRDYYLTQARVSEKVRNETLECAREQQESLSEYIRKAVEYRNNIIKSKKQ